MKRFLTITAVFWLLLGGIAGAQTYTQSEGTLDTSIDTIAAGDVVTVSGSGFASDSDVEVVLNDGSSGAEVVLATATADANGDFSAEVTIPEDFSGDGVLFARGTAADGGTLVLAIGINGGSTEQLAFTGASETSRWLVYGALVSIVMGALMLGSRKLRNAG